MTMSWSFQWTSTAASRTRSRLARPNPAGWGWDDEHFGVEDLALFAHLDLDVGDAGLDPDAADRWVFAGMPALKCNADSASTKVHCRPEQEVTRMSLPHKMRAVMRYHLDVRLGELRAEDEATLPVGLER